MSRTSGGQKKTDVWEIDTTAGSSTVTTTAALIAMADQETTDVAALLTNKAGKEVSLNHLRNDADLSTYMNDYMTEAAGDGEEVILEDGATATAGSNSVPTQLGITYGGGYGGQIQVWVYCCRTYADGNITLKDKTFARVPFTLITEEFNGTGTGTASALVVPTAAFDSAIVDAADVQIAADALEIPVGSVGVELWIDAA